MQILEQQNDELTGPDHRPTSVSCLPPVPRSIPLHRLERDHGHALDSPSATDPPPASANGENSPFVLIQVRRSSLISDLLAHFENDDERHVHVEVIGEQAVDNMGVFRDVLTDFWTDVIGRYFEGDVEAVPVVSPSVTENMWRAIGNVFVRGFLQAGYLPLQFSVASIARSLFGDVSLEMLMQSWLATLGGYKRKLMTRMLAGGFTHDDKDDLVDVFDRYHVKEMPNAGNVRRLAQRCASVMCVEQALYPLTIMRLERLRSSFDSIESLTNTLRSLRPDGRKIAAMITAEIANPQQKRVVQFLRQFIKSAYDQLLRNFLRFCSGSDVVNFSNIYINFVHLRGLARRVVAHTCSVTLDLPTSYNSYNEFSNELQQQLNSDFWEMDFA
ncbi:uncharacterized protein LOC128237720 [Mya arenaria]|nr:uncharacterized protein LOC128237720 [Mya arenaria]